MKEYKEIKKEISEIAKILKDYPDSLHEEVYRTLMNSFLGEQFEVHKSKPDVKSPPIKKKTITSKSSDTKQTAKKARKSGSKESYSIVKSLDLKGNSKKPSLQEFCQDKNMSSAVKFNTLAVYYLKKIAGIDKVTLNHIYTCYKEVGQRVPAKLKQSLWDTAGPKYGYLDTSDTDNITIPTSGENYVEHDLIKKTKAK